MSRGWTVVLISSAIIYCFKAAGPMVLGSRALPAWLHRLTTLVPAALLAALVVVATLGNGRALQLDARAVGVAAAVVALWRKANFVVVVACAAAATALTRQLAGG